VVMQAALLVRYAPQAVSDAFCASRLAASEGLAGPGVSFGTLPRGLDLGAVLGRTRPVVTG
jgi:putative acyl-CoA dehydrogenase